MLHSDIGTLFFPDGREFGDVKYAVDVVEPTATTRGRISGNLQTLDTEAHFPFFDFHQSPEGYGALRMADGRWWLCNIQADGRASNRGGIHPPGPQPKIG